MTQTVGFNAFSYIDVADQVGIKSSSVHYHFRAKGDLALALVQRTHDAHLSSFEGLETDLDSPEERLEALIRYFQAYVEDERFCLCGMMAAELNTRSMGPS